MSFAPLTLVLASLGGIIPALVWLWFWLHEDKKRPEPRGKLIITFIAGMIAVLLVLPLEKWTGNYFTPYSTPLFLSWAIIEESLKFVLAYIVALRAKDMDEPIDAVIYMITAALGFAALENALFLLTPIENGEILQSIITGNLRFLGAAVLHTLASGIIGACIGFAFYKSRLYRAVAIGIGLILAIALHTHFNFLIINSHGSDVMGVFAYVWFGVVILLMVIERIKRIRRHSF